MPEEAPLPALPPRPADGHKGTFGTVCVVGGQCEAPRVMIGGPALCALAALRVGAGLAVLAMPEPLLAAGLTIAPSATGLALPVDAQGRLVPNRVAEVLDAHAEGLSCVAIGPGLGPGPAAQQILARLITQTHVPLVIDADALNALAALREVQRDLRAACILTPHPGEYQRLAAALGIAIDVRRAERREEAAMALAQRLGCVVVLKGRHTVVSDGRSAFVNRSGNVALATAGTGDVLTGIIAGLVAQFAARGGDTAAPGRLSLLECARWGARLHGRAADRWRERHGDAGMLAADLLLELPDALRAEADPGNP
jgi:NAD(P)H-hydrate epimerase